MRPTRCRWCRTKALAERGKRCWAPAQFRVKLAVATDRDGDFGTFYVCAPHLLAAVRVERAVVVRFLRGNPSSFIPRVLNKLGWPVAERTWKTSIAREDTVRKRLAKRAKAQRARCPSIHRATDLRCTRGFHLGGMHEALRTRAGVASLVQWGRAGERSDELFDHRHRNAPPL